ncbi:hypothetical protein QUF90_01905 [Desulfococcaceae bacterium HSG9]|nr:hypothetical protein [Desulfococcaceae bacterium HSG9]
MSNPLKKPAFIFSDISGTILVLLVVIILLFQGISAWKIMHLDQERMAFESDKEKMTRDLVQYQSLQKQLPELIRKKEAIIEELPRLEGELAALKTKRLTWLKDQAKAMELIEHGKAATEIRTELKDAVDSLRKEIQLKTEEVRKLAGPTSVLNQSARDLGALVTSQKNLPESFKSEFKHATEELQSASATIGKAAINLRANALNFAQSAKSANTILDKAARATQGTVKQISTVENKLSKYSNMLSLQSERFTDKLNTLDSEITNIQNMRKNLQNFSIIVTRMDADSVMTFSKLRGLIDNSQTALKQWQANAQSLNEFIRTMALQKDTIANTTEMLRSQINALAKTSKQIITETQDFRIKLKKYAPSDAKKAIQSYEKKLSASSKKIESDADKIYNLNFNLEKELRKLIVESENLNKMLRSHQNKLKKKKKQ